MDFFPVFIQIFWRFGSSLVEKKHLMNKKIELFSIFIYINDGYSALGYNGPGKASEIEKIPGGHRRLG